MGMGCWYGDGICGHGAGGKRRGRELKGLGEGIWLVIRDGGMGIDGGLGRNG